MNIVPSAAERAAGCLSGAKVAAAAAAVCEQGFVVLEDVVGHDSLDALSEKLIEDTKALVRARDSGRKVSGWMRGHLQQRPPPAAPYIFPDIVANPYAVQVTHAVLGDGLFNTFYSGNTNLPGSEEQPLHRDAALLWPAWETAHPPATLVVNISPISVDEATGSTEIWPASHLVTGELTEALIESRRQQRPPVRVRAPRGSVVIRDIRLWHRGVPNESDQIRHMIAMVHQIHWFRRAQRLRFERGCEAAFDSQHLDANADFVDGPEEYLFGPHPPHS
jgi:hypothetical protein